MALSLVVLAAGLGSRYGGQKQLTPVGPGGETLMDYTIYDALRSGYERIVLVTRPGEEGVVGQHLAAASRGGAPVVYVPQRLDDLPPGGSPPPKRSKPWGTGQAVLAVENAIDGPFAVANADDYYGTSSMRLLRACLERVGRHPRICLVGYPLRETLSEHGGVSRAVCEVDDHGRVLQVEELSDVRMDGEVLVGYRGAIPVRPSGAEIVSMNLWGFGQDVFPLLRREFVSFLDSRGGDPNAEFLLPDAVGEIVAAGLGGVRLVPAREAWFGMTYSEDRDHAARRIRELVRQGVYPAPLFTSERS